MTKQYIFVLHSYIKTTEMSESFHILENFFDFFLFRQQQAFFPLVNDAKTCYNIR